MIEPRAFVGRFVLPLCRGGELHVGRPLGSSELAALLRETELGLHEEDARLEEARASLLRGLWLYPIALPWDDSSAKLAAGIHNLLSLGHPELGRGRSGRARVESFTRGLLALPGPADLEEALRRHTLCHGVLELTRTDLELDTWAAVYSFRGQQPPPRLLRWKRLRRVREVRRTVSWISETLADEQLELLGLLLDASPLTALLTPTRPRPELDLGRVASYLRWPAVARLCAHAYLERGLLEVGPALARAFWRVADGQTRWADRRVEIACGLVSYLFAARALARSAAPLEGQEELEADLTAVLLAVADCGLLPSLEVIGDPEVARQLEKQNELTRRRLGESGAALKLRLQRSLAA
jgi:hypothetical protein